MFAFYSIRPEWSEVLNVPVLSQNVWLVTDCFPPVNHWIPRPLNSAPAILNEALARCQNAEVWRKPVMPLVRIFHSLPNESRTIADYAIHMQECFRHHLRIEIRIIFMRCILSKSNTVWRIRQQAISIPRLEVAQHFPTIPVVDGDAVFLEVGFHFPPNSSSSSLRVLIVASKLRSLCMLEIFFFPFFPVRQDSDGR